MIFAYWWVSTETNRLGLKWTVYVTINYHWIDLAIIGLHQRSRTMAPLSPAPRMSPDPRIPTWNWTTFGYFDKVCLSAWSCGCWGCSEESASIINITFQFFEIIKFPYRSKLPQNKRLIFILSHKLELQLQKHTYDHNIIEDDPVLYPVYISFWKSCIYWETLYSQFENIPCQITLHYFIWH